MSRREVSRILGVNPSAGKSKVSPKKIMLLNHHDNGGSPYLVTKINLAKDLVESSAKNLKPIALDHRRFSRCIGKQLSRLLAVHSFLALH